MIVVLTEQGILYGIREKDLSVSWASDVGPTSRAGIDHRDKLLKARPPLVCGHAVVVEGSTGHFPDTWFFAAFDARDGRELWRLVDIHHALVLVRSSDELHLLDMKDKILYDLDLKSGERSRGQLVNSSYHYGRRRCLFLAEGVLFTNDGRRFGLLDGADAESSKEWQELLQRFLDGLGAIPHLQVPVTRHGVDRLWYGMPDEPPFLSRIVSIGNPQRAT